MPEEMICMTAPIAMKATEEAKCLLPFTEVICGVVPAGWPVQGDELLALVKRSVAPWEKHSALRFKVVMSNAEHHIRMPTGVIDGPGRVLAWSQLPCPWRGRIDQRYDIREDWTLDWDERGKVSLPQTICHEVGHALGISHGPSGNIMYFSSGGWTKEDLGPWDIKELRSRYPASGPVEPGPGEPPVQKFWQCIFQAGVQLVTCLSQGQAEAKATGVEGPFDYLKGLLSGSSQPQSDQNVPRNS